MGYLASRAYDAKNHMEFFCFGSLVLEESGWQGSSIYYLMSAWRMTKTTVRPGCTAGVRYPNYYLKILYNSECGYNYNAELNMYLSFSTGNSVTHLPISYLYRRSAAYWLRMQSLKANWFEFWLCTYQL